MLSNDSYCTCRTTLSMLIYTAFHSPPPGSQSCRGSVQHVEGHPTRARGFSPRASPATATDSLAACTARLKRVYGTPRTSQSTALTASPQSQPPDSPPDSASTRQSGREVVTRPMPPGSCTPTPHQARRAWQSDVRCDTTPGIAVSTRSGVPRSNTPLPAPELLTRMHLPKPPASPHVRHAGGPGVTLIQTQAHGTDPYSAPLSVLARGQQRCIPGRVGPEHVGPRLQVPLLVQYGQLLHQGRAELREGGALRRLRVQAAAHQAGELVRRAAREVRKGLPGREAVVGQVAVRHAAAGQKAAWRARSAACAVSSHPCNLTPRVLGAMQNTLD